MSSDARDDPASPPPPSTSTAKKPWRSRFAWLHPKLYLGLHTTIGLACSAAATWAFFAIADEVPEKGLMVRADTAVTVWLQTTGTERGESIFSAISLLGSPILAGLLVIVAIVLLVRRDWRHLALLAVTCGGGGLLNLALKASFHRARPSFASEFETGGTWSFPSGHAMDSFIGYGLLAYWIARRFPRVRRPAIMSAVGLVLLIGFSRIYLGVHYLSDVLAGYSAGCVWLAVCVTAADFAERRRVGPAGADEAH